MTKIFVRGLEGLEREFDLTADYSEAAANMGAWCIPHAGLPQLAPNVEGLLLVGQPEQERMEMFAEMDRGRLFNIMVAGGIQMLIRDGVRVMEDAGLEDRVLSGEAIHIIFR